MGDKTGSEFRCDQPSQFAWVRGIPGYRIFRATTRPIPANQDQLVTVSVPQAAWVIFYMTSHTPTLATFKGVPIA